MERKSIVVSDPDILEGAPCFRGTRVPVDPLNDYLEAGDTLDEFFGQFPFGQPRSRDCRAGGSQGRPHQHPMRILIDENLPRKIVMNLARHECRSVVGCGWAGEKNGALLALADPVFDVFLALDKNLPDQQKLDTVRIAVMILHAQSNRMADLFPLLPECLAALRCVTGRQVVRVGSPLSW